MNCRFKLSIFLLALGSFFSCTWREIEEEPKGPAVEGEAAPSFSFEDRFGQRLLLSDFRGKVVLINFWATWCVPCRDEMPSMDSLRRQMDPSRFAIVALSVDDSWDVVNQFMTQSDFTVPVYSDFDRKISTLYGTSKFPETYIVDKKGKVAKKVIGPTDWTAPDMVTYLRELTAESNS
jgi:cytochrome c biogenesis protein CcmG/thiol:disulfide interchange protein DsbE